MNTEPKWKCSPVEMRYAQEMQEKIAWLAKCPPLGILAGNVASLIQDCADEIEGEINQFEPHD